MKNTTTVEGSVATILLEHRSGVEYEAIVDTEDLPKLKILGRTWRANPQNNDSVYVVSSTSGVNLKLHRVITDCPEGMVVDHINGNPLDNRKVNLRVVTHQQNQQNRRTAQVNSKSGIRGVCWVPARNKWKAYVRVNGKQIHLGVFSDVKDAEKAAKDGRHKYMSLSEVEFDV